MPGPYPLSSLAPTIDQFGCHTLAIEDILSSLQASYSNINGSDAYIAPDSQPGQWIAVLTQAIYDFNQVILTAYNSYSPQTAQGVGLSSVVKTNGLRRLLPTNSTAPILCTGVAGTEIISGIVRDQAGNEWALPAVVVIDPILAQVTATGTCLTPGAILAPAGSIQDIVNPTPSWQTAVNTEDAIPGAPVETDPALRARQAISTSLPAQTTREAIEASIANVPGVQRHKVYENSEDAPDANGIPGHTIAAVVAGGDAFAIAQAIAAKKSPGTGTFGTTTEVVLDSQGVPDTINFFELETVSVYAAITIKALSGYVSTTGNLLVTAVQAFINDIEIGTNVYLARLWAPAGLTGDAAVSSSGLTQAQLDPLAATYVVQSIQIGTNPTALGTADITIPFYAAAACFTSGNIVLTTH